MAVVKGIRICNYRSVGDSGAAIYFPEGSPVVLIGENNAGKSNLISAIELILGERWPKNFEPEEHDFHGRSRDKIITIQVHFPDTDEGAYGRDFTEVRYEYNPHSDADPVTYGALPPMKSYQDYAYINKNDRDSCVCIVVGAERNLDYQLSYRSKYTFLSKLMRRFHMALIEDESTKQDLEDIFADIKDKFHEIDSFSTFVNSLKTNLSDLAASMTHQLEVDFQAYNPINFFRALRLQAVDNGAVRTLEELGTGEEQILAISFAHAYAQAFHGGILLIIEEPEAHLHPTMQRWLARRIHKMSADGLQIVLTTHSPSFINLLNLEGLVVVRKDNGQTITTQKTREHLVNHCVETGVPENRVSEENILPFYKAHGTLEILGGFFAKKVILVEGATEQLALPEYFRKAGLDVLKQNIEIIGVGGKGDLAKWWRLFSLYNIPTYIIFDNDESDDGKGQRRRDALSAMNVNVDQIDAALREDDWLINEHFAVFGVDFETIIKRYFPSYEDVESQGAEFLSNTSKPLLARYVARHLTYEENHAGWEKFDDLALAIRHLSI